MCCVVNGCLVTMGDCLLVCRVFYYFYKYLTDLIYNTHVPTRGLRGLKSPEKHLQYEKELILLYHRTFFSSLEPLAIEGVTL